MTFLELQKRILQTRKARKGVRNRTDYFDDCSWNEEQFWRNVYQRALRVATDVVQHYEGAGELDKTEKVSVLFGNELVEYRHEISRLNKELEQVKAELARAKIGGRRKDRAKEAKIQQYKREHPDASIRGIAKAVGCSTTTVQAALRVVKSSAEGTLSVIVPQQQERKKLERLVAGLVDAIAKDTSDKDREIHQQSLRYYQSMIDL